MQIASQLLEHLVFVCTAGRRRLESLKMLCYALLISVFLNSVLALTSDFDRNISVPEGLFVYPKTILKLDLKSHRTSRCYVENTTTISPNNSVSDIEKQYFGVALELQEQHSANRLALQKRDTGPLAESPQPSTAPATTASTGTSGFNTTNSGDIGANFTYEATTASTAVSAVADTTASQPAPNSTSTTTTAAVSHVTNAGPLVLELQQLRDLDRETHDNYELTVACVDVWGVQSEPIRMIEVNVEDVNDNTPVFNVSSLHATVSADVNDSSVMQIRATDRDIGLNAKLSFRMIRGSQTNMYPDGTRQVPNFNVFGPNMVVVDSNGLVYLFQPDLEPEMVMTFKVVVKDLGDLSYGNRATATATIEVCCSGPSTPTNDKADSKLEWWMIAVPVLGVVVVLGGGAAAFVLLRYRRKRARPALVIDDHFLLDGDREDSFPA